MKWSKPLVEHTAEPLDSVRLERQWGAISEQLPSSSRRTRATRWILAGALAMTTALVVFGWQLDVLREDDQHLVFEATEEVRRVSLGDGTSIRVAESTKLEVHRGSEGTVVRLRSGEARFEVPPDAVDRFEVVAGPVRVFVRGTIFSVHFRDDGEVGVSVQRGEVEVRQRGQSVFLQASESWPKSKALPVAKPRSSTATPTSRPKEPSVAVKQEPTEPEEASREPAVELFDQAEAARFAGNAKQAANLFAQLVREFPQDPRAGLAAFQLARLRLDSLSDPQGALAALETALRLNPSASFREDAQARRVEALDRLGRAAGCRQARRQYLKRFPQGLHRAEVSARCDSSSP